MHYSNLFKQHLVIVACIGTFLISGCTSTKQANTASDVGTQQTNTQISDEELAQLKASSEEWQAAKSGVERLLVIEQDLKLLISQLNAVAKPQNTGASSDKVATVNAPPQVAPVKAVKPQVITADKQPAINALFALQVAAVTDKTRLHESLNEIRASAAALFEGEFVANIEDINVGGVTYYRLKLGAYQNHANATADCNKLKQRKISCIVSHYTSQPLN